MQSDLASMLQQKSHLAALGLAVSKINHDLRNLLTSAQLFSDRLATISDPHVQRFAPKLMRALERAIAFCQSTLSYGRAQEPPPDRRSLALEPLVEEVRETLGLEPEAPIRWIGAVERGLAVDADPDQLFRILLNLARNAVQALESRDPNDPGRDQIRVTGRREGAVVVIEVSDTGPGVPEQARAHLFEAFQGSTRTGGAGLGLAIAAELVRAHGGDIRLVEGTIGATFRAHHPGPRGRARQAARAGERVRGEERSLGTYSEAGSTASLSSCDAQLSYSRHPEALALLGEPRRATAPRVPRIAPALCTVGEQSRATSRPSNPNLANSGRSL